MNSPATLFVHHRILPSLARLSSIWPIAVPEEKHESTWPSTTTIRSKRVARHAIDDPPKTTGNLHQPSPLRLPFKTRHPMILQRNLLYTASVWLWP